MRLGSDSATYLVVLLDRRGNATVRYRNRGADSILVPWTPNPAIRPHPGQGVVANQLRVGVAPDSIRVFVNDSAVASVDRGRLPIEGHFGFRTGEGINLHLTSLDHTRHLAPWPR